MRIFCAAFSCGFLCADFRADFGFFACGFQCGFLCGFFLEDFLAGRLQGERQKNPPHKILPKILSESSQGKFASQPSLRLGKSRVRTWVPVA